MTRLNPPTPKTLGALLLLASCVVAMATAQQQSTAMMDDVMTTAFMTTAEPEVLDFSLAMRHRESSTSSISIRWSTKVPVWVAVDKYVITVIKQGSSDVMTSPEIDGERLSYVVNDLIKDSTFDVCIVATLRNVTEFVDDEESVEERQFCMESFTIPYIRNDSVYMLLIACGYIGLMILIGYVSWRCAVSKAQKQAEDDEAEEEEESEEGKPAAVVPRNEIKPVLLSPVNAQRPKSSIEDEDIPFITPPWSEIERQHNAKATTNSVG